MGFKPFKGTIKKAVWSWSFSALTLDSRILLLCDLDTLSKQRQGEYFDELAALCPSCPSLIYGPRCYLTVLHINPLQVFSGVALDVLVTSQWYDILIPTHMANYILGRTQGSKGNVMQLSNEK